MISIADLANVKKLTIPDGVVKKIRVNDVYVWEETNEVTYTPIDYIQFTGVQDIDTGITCNQNTKIEVKFTRENSESRWLYGVRNSANTTSVTAYLGSSGGSWRFGGAYRNYTIPLNQVCTMAVNKSGITYNGTTSKYASGSVGTFTANGTLTLGSARNNSGTYGSPQFIGKIYSFKMYDDSTLVADYIPSVSSDGEYGFYDNVSKEFKTSRSQPFNNETASFAINTLELAAFNEVESSEIGQPTEMM